MAKFIRKRDPRYKAHLACQVAPISNQASGSVTPARKAAPPVEQFVEQDWQKVDTPNVHADLDWAAAEGEDSEEWECVACRKTFRSEAAWDSHERSKKHMREVELLKQVMRDESRELELDEDAGDATPRVSDASSGEEGASDQPTRSLSPSRTDQPPEAAAHGASDSESVPPREDSGEEGEHVVRKQKKKKKPGHVASYEPLTKTEKKVATRGDMDISQSPLPAPGSILNGEGDAEEEHKDVSGPPELSKREKRRAKQANKAAAGEKPESGDHKVGRFSDCAQNILIDGAICTLAPV